MRIAPGTAQLALVALQAWQVAILWVHDWIPLGRLNDIAAVRAANSTARLVRVTLIQSVPYTLLLAWSLGLYGHPWPGQLVAWLGGAYGLLLAGELKAWWIPYAVGADAARVERHRAMFGHTHAFLPPRHGLVPNTLHVMLHAATLATVAVLLARLV